MSLSFAELGLAADVTRAVAESGYTQPTPVQQQAIPPIVQGRDVLAAAQNGTGKTAAFILPLLQRLNDTPPETLAQQVRALIVTPTRELAMQVEDCVREFGRYLPLRSTAIYGGVNMGPQIEALQEGVEILVATPGRLLDHANEQTVDLSHVEILLLDDADRMLEMGFMPDLQRVLALLPPQRQNLLFAATLSNDIRALADGVLNNPVALQAAPALSVSAPVLAQSAGEAATQRVLSTGQDRKRALLTHLIKKGDWKKVLVFTRTKHGANRLAHQLGRTGIATTAIHGNKGPGGGNKALDDFMAGKVRVLVATDLAARSLELEQLPHVVNFDLPQAAEDYMRRVVRTGEVGEAVSLVAPEEQPLLSEIEKFIGRTLEQTLIPGFEPGSVSPRELQRQQQLQQQQQAQQPQQQHDSQADAAAPQAGREGGRRRRGRGRNRQNGEARNGENRETRAEVRGDGRNDGRNERRGEQPGQAREPATAIAALNGNARLPRHQRGESNGNRSNGQARHNHGREDNDNRGNRDTSRRDKRNVILDDDFGNRIPPVKLNRGIRARIAAGDIDEELDNIGNRMPPPPKHQRHLSDPSEEDEVNYNVAPPPVEYPHEDDERQPLSNAGQLFPSSAGFMSDLRPGRGNGGNGNGNGRRRRRGGSGGNGQGQNPQRQAQPHQGQQRHAQRQGKKRGGGGKGRQPGQQRGH